MLRTIIGMLLFASVEALILYLLWDYRPARVVAIAVLQAELIYVIRDSRVQDNINSNQLHINALFDERIQTLERRGKAT
jgi:hypothetical protein